MNIEAVFIDPKDDILIKSQSFYKIALCEEGHHYSSLDWAKHLSLLMQKQTKIAFLIGEASGLSRDVIDRASETLSLSAFTLPHRMAFLVLCEQLYRTCEILRNSPYHK
jgi:23S rRNA (pseudouridine1915-N3)-methyltransferase